MTTRQVRTAPAKSLATAWNAQTRSRKKRHSWRPSLIQPPGQGCSTGHFLVLRRGGGQEKECLSLASICIRSAGLAPQSPPGLQESFRHVSDAASRGLLPTSHCSARLCRLKKMELGSHGAGLFLASSGPNVRLPSQGLPRLSALWGLDTAPGFAAQGHQRRAGAPPTSLPGQKARQGGRAKISKFPWNLN